MPELGPPCTHSRGHITDSAFFGDRYATPTSRRVFCDLCRAQRWLTVEAALAQAQGAVGVIPQAVAERITSAARIELLDLDRVRAETAWSGHSLVGLLHGLETACGNEAGQYVHFGATTQDIQDTAQSLEMRDALDALGATLAMIGRRLADLAQQHARTVGLARTHAQPALPTTFGLKVASWLDEVVRHIDRLTQLRRRVLVAQLFGGAGTMAGLGSQGPAVLREFAARLDLAVPQIGWHVARDRVAEYVSTMAMVACTMGRIADEVRTLARPEFGEVSEPWRYGNIGSSTMPHKRNPESCEQVVVLARLSTSQVPLALMAMMGDHERDGRALRLEWACVPDVSHYTLSACSILAGIVDGLQVHTEQMHRNVIAVSDLVASEPLMFALAHHIGKQRAYQIVYEIAQQAHDDELNLRQALRAASHVGTLLGSEDIDRIVDPDSNVGRAVELTESVVEMARTILDHC